MLLTFKYSVCGKWTFPLWLLMKGYSCLAVVCITAFNSFDIVRQFTPRLPHTELMHYSLGILNMKQHQRC